MELGLVRRFYEELWNKADDNALEVETLADAS